MQKLRQWAVTLLQQCKPCWSWLGQWWRTVTSQPLWVYLFVAVLLVLCAVDIGFFLNNIDPFFILPFYLLPFIFFASLPYRNNHFLCTIKWSFAFLLGITLYAYFIADFPLYDYIVVEILIIPFGYWGYRNAYQFFYPINGRRTSRSFWVAIVLLLLSPLIVLPIFVLPYYLLGAACAVVLIGLDKCFHVLREDRRLRTYLLAMLCCYICVSGNEWLLLYTVKWNCFGQVNQARVIAPQMRGMGLNNQIQFYPAKRYPSLSNMYTKEIKVWPYRVIYSDYRTGKIYFEEKGYSMSSRRPFTWYEKWVNRFVGHLYGTGSSDTSFVESTAFECPRSLSDFAKQNGFTVFPQTLMPSDKGENDGK